MLLTVADFEDMAKRPVPPREGEPICAVDLGGSRAWSAALVIYPSGRIECRAVAPGAPERLPIKSGGTEFLVAPIRDWWIKERWHLGSDGGASRPPAKSVGRGDQAGPGADRRRIVSVTGSGLTNCAMLTCLAESLRESRAGPNRQF